ncbi:methylglyoxal synthase [Pseudomonas sp. HR96]|uniref:methylglyoxal synthase n=1 Tax=Pseudomonas sp. HR96 TaxID=1027966 RepID=UPI002A762E71|nr:methylglyoxal synthase [Pseudomonas sp. HR96]WPO98680.1 methylglyoxal synthase [Pseudomonas sp. HR96]
MSLACRTIASRKRIALVAHDECKQRLRDWVGEHSKVLVKHSLYATCATARMIQDIGNLKVIPLLSGPLGGDQQLGAMVAEGRIDMLIFFWDPLAVHPHDDDIKALMRVATAWNIPTASNASTAEFLITSRLFRRSLVIRTPG